MAIPILGYILAWIFPIYINLYRRDLVDLHRDTPINATKANPIKAEVEFGQLGESERTKASHMAS
jgi:FHS family L-fucose permease-like MFS transporter